MSLAIITLPTNKSISTVSDHVRKLGQGEKGQTLDVIVTDANNSAYDLSDKTIQFSENKDGGKIVSDNESAHFSITDAKAGRFTYTLAPAVYAASGTAWFDIISSDGKVIDTTKSFDIQVIEDESIHINNDNYVSNLQAFQDHYDAVIQRSKEDSDALLTKINDQLSKALADNNKAAADALTDQKSQVKALTDSLSQLQTSLNDEISKAQTQLSDIKTAADSQTKKIQDAADAKIQSIESDYETQKQSIQDAADQQLKNNKTANDDAIAKIKSDAQTAIDKVGTDEQTAIKAVNDAKDSAISQANTDFSNKLSSIQSDYDSWKQTTTSDFQSKLDTLGQELKTDEDAQSNLKSAIDSAQEAVSQIKNVDFTQFAHKTDLDNYYTKTEVDAKVASAGKLKTISINGGTAIGPDTNGNADLAIPQPDLSGYETKADASTALAAKANTADVYDKTEVDEKVANAGKVKTVNGTAPDDNGNVEVDLSNLETKADASTKADKASVDTINSTVTSLNTQVSTNTNDIKAIRTKLSDGSLAEVAKFKTADEQKALDWSKDDGKGGLPKIGIIEDS